MITVTVTRDTKGLSGFTISGHAGYDEAGSDIVCAAVSAVSETTLLGLLRYLPDETYYDVDDSAV